MIDFTALLHAQTNPGPPFADGAAVLRFLDEPGAVPGTIGFGNGMLPGQPQQTRRAAFLEAVSKWPDVPGAAGLVGLTERELSMAVEASTELARALEIATAVGIRANLETASAAARHRWITNRTIDRIDEKTDAGADYMAMKAKLAAMLAEEQGDATPFDPAPPAFNAHVKPV